MRKASLFAAAFAMLGLSGTAAAEVFAFISNPITPTQEVPAITSNGYGRITALYDNVTKVLMYNVTWQLNKGTTDSTVTNAHFHAPSPVGGASAGVAVAVSTTDMVTKNSGRSAGAVTLTAAQETDLLAGNMYFNIHSTLAAGGELRGQLIANPNATGATFINNVLSIPTVLVPGITGANSYNADLTYDGNTFSLTNVTAVR